MKKLADEELMDAQFDHWEQLEHGGVIEFHLTQDENEYYPIQYLSAGGAIKNLELLINSPATLYVFAQGPVGSHIELWFLQNEQYKLLDTIHDTEFGKIHNTDIASQHNTIFFFFKMKNTGAATGRHIHAFASLSHKALERKIQKLS